MTITLTLSEGSVSGLWMFIIGLAVVGAAMAAFALWAGRSSGSSRANDKT